MCWFKTVTSGCPGQLRQTSVIASLARISPMWRPWVRCPPVWSLASYCRWQVGWVLDFLDGLAAECEGIGASVSRRGLGIGGHHHDFGDGFG